MAAFQGLGDVKSATIAHGRAGVFPKHWWPRPWVCLLPFRRCGPTTAYANKVDRIATRYETFQEEFSSILQRQLQKRRAGLTEQFALWPLLRVDTSAAS